MMVFERRASAILYNILRSRGDPRPFLLPANICPIVPETFVAAEQPFELVDIAAGSLAMDEARCVELLGDQPFAGALFARPYGSERDATRFLAALRDAQSDLFLIDDKCLCRPDCDNATTSPLADVTLYSTGYAKYADIGQGGFAHLGESVAYRRADTGPAWLDLRAPDVRWSEHRRGTIDAADAAEQQKETLNAIYAGALPDEVQLPRELQQWRFNILVPAAEGLAAAAFASGLFLSRHYAPLGDFPVAQWLHAQVVNLFNDRYFDAGRATRMTELVLRHLDMTRA